MLRLFVPVVPATPIVTINDYLTKVINLDEAGIRAIASQLDFSMLQRFVYTDLPNKRKEYDIKPVCFDKLMLMFKTKGLTNAMLSNYYNHVTNHQANTNALTASDFDMSEDDFSVYIATAKEAFKDRFAYDRVVRVTNDEFNDRTLKAFQNAHHLSSGN